MYNEKIPIIDTSHVFNETPCINELLVDFACNSNIDIQLDSIISFLNNNRIECLQLRFYYSITFDELILLAKSLYASNISTIQLILPFDSITCTDNLSLLFNVNNLISTFYLYNFPQNLQSVNENVNFTVYCIENKILSEKCCGLISPFYFKINRRLYIEAQQHNTCLNRKISIDVNGEIKNCPSMEKSYGNIKDTTLAEAIEKPGFKDLWDINKDKIHVCKDCEFRYICTDCRAYIENPEDIFSKPLKCGYNPYTAEWEEWSTNPLKQKAIEFYGMQELIKKEK